MTENKQPSATRGITGGTIHNTGRRKVVKTIVCGVTAFAAYNVLPAKWGTPIIEQIFLPAHAQTSGQVNGNFQGSVNVLFIFVQNSPGQKNGDLLANVSNAVGNFFVTEAHALATEVSQSWCVTLAGNTATFYGDTSMASGIVIASGPVNSIIEHIDGSAHYYLEILETTPDSIRIQVIVDYDSDRFEGIGWLTRSTGSCNVPA